MPVYRAVFMCVYVCTMKLLEFLRCVYMCHWRELSINAGDSLVIRRWADVWVQPVLDLLTSSETSHSLKSRLSNVCNAFPLLHRVSKNVPHLTCYNLDMHGLITIIFGTSVTEEVGNQNMLYFPTSPNLCFCTTWENRKPKKCICNNPKV